MTVAYLSVPDERTNFFHILSNPSDMYGASPCTYGTEGLLFNADLALGYSRFSSRENGRRLFHPPWVGEAGEGLTQDALLRFCKRN
jgi:hypothetical protein